MDWKKTDWKKVLMYSSFATGAVLFLSGRKPAGLAAAGIGLATLASRHPEKFEELWHRMPEYLDKGSQFIETAAGFLEQLKDQAEAAAEEVAESGLHIAQGGRS
jgi:hypothetical protein